MQNLRWMQPTSQAFVLMVAGLISAPARGNANEATSPDEQDDVRPVPLESPEAPAHSDRTDQPAVYYCPGFNPYSPSVGAVGVGARLGASTPGAVEVALGAWNSRYLGFIGGSVGIAVGAVLHTSGDPTTLLVEVDAMGPTMAFAAEAVVQGRFATDSGGAGFRLGIGAGLGMDRALAMYARGTVGADVEDGRWKPAVGLQIGARFGVIVHSRVEYWPEQGEVTTGQ